MSDQIDVIRVIRARSNEPDSHCSCCGGSVHVVIIGGAVGINLCQPCAERLCEELCR